MIAVDLLILLVVILLHEAGHLVAAISLGIRVRRIGVSWKGMYIVREAGPPLVNMITTLAGPYLNLLLAMAWPAAHMFALMNLVFGLTNLIPLGGSDGQRALTLLAKEFRQRAI